MKTADSAPEKQNLSLETRAHTWTRNSSRYGLEVDSEWAREDEALLCSPKLSDGWCPDGDPQGSPGNFLVSGLHTALTHRATSHKATLTSGLS